MPNHDGRVLSICNALVDILIEISDADFEKLGIEKGVMHLVDQDRQAAILETFKDKAKIVELGGSAMNATRALAALGSQTMFFGTIGDDTFGHELLQRMESLGITSRVKTTDHPTGTCVILITPDGERTMNTFLGASLHYHEGILPRSDISESKILHLTGYQWSTDHQRYAIKQALEVAKQCSTVISFDVADPMMCRGFREDFIRTIETYADIVFANTQEASDLFDCEPEEAATRITDLDAIAVIKLGAKGAFVKKGSDSYRVGPVKTTVVDTTAAGDMFAAGFLYGYLKQRSLLEAGHFGAMLASDVISRIGAVLSNKVIEDVKKQSQ